jgi:hypothetical protein
MQCAADSEPEPVQPWKEKLDAIGLRAYMAAPRKHCEEEKKTKQRNGKMTPRKKSESAETDLLPFVKRVERRPKRSNR